MIINMLYKIRESPVDPHDFLWLHFYSGSSLLWLLREDPPGNLLQTAVAGHLASERGPALGTPGQLGPGGAGAAHDVTLATLPDLSRTMSSRCHTIRSDLGWGLADINADGTVKTLQDLLVLSGTGKCLLEKSEVMI